VRQAPATVAALRPEAEDERPGARDPRREPDPFELLTVGEVAKLLKVPKSWVYERTRRRGVSRLPFVKLGKYVRFEASAIRAFLALQRDDR
jgi:excisionase family DNA binding protein